jgi:hypothetical protein
MILIKPCPFCGKPMEEQPKFPGLWMCPDYRNPINDAPPFEYKCRGIEMTDEAAADFEELLTRKYIERNAKLN